jgi:uncharacterized protein YndB with AHSA1/START domain
MRSIDLSIEITATVDEVWNAITTGEGLARWFAPIAEVEPGVGGSVGVGWEPGQVWRTPIVVWEPMARLGTAKEMPRAGGAPVRLAVDYHLDARAGGVVVVRLVHSGFGDGADWDDQIDGLTAGWTYFLFNLKHAIERHRGVPRRLVSARLTMTVPAGDPHPIFGPAMLDVRPPMPTLSQEQPCSLQVGGERFDARLAMARPPRACAFVIPALDDALLFVERESPKDTHTLGVWLSLYGVGEARATALQGALSGLAG